MTPTTIRARLLAFQHAELHRLVDELKAYPPTNALELIRCCQRELGRVKAEAEALQVESVKSDLTESRLPGV